MIITLFIFSFIILGSLLFTFLVSSLLRSDKETSNPAMEAIIQTNMALISTSTIDLIGEISAIITGKTLIFVSGLPSQSLNLARFGAVVGGAFIFHESYTYFLTGGDTIFRSLLGPLFEEVIFSVMQILRLFFDAIVPLYNYYATIFGQLVVGSIGVAVKCDLNSVVQTFKLLLMSFISLFKSTIDFAGGRSVDNNIMVNEWNMTSTFVRFQGVVAKQEDIASCVCDGFTDIFEILFVLVKTPHLPRALNHLWNIPISLIQEVLQILPPYTKIPHLTKPVYHIGAYTWEFAKFMDLAGITIVKKIIQLFVPGFTLQGIPEQFIIATQVRLWLAVLEIGHVLFRTAIHVIVPINGFITNPEYMSQAMDFSKAILHLELWNYGNVNFLHWVALMIKRMSIGSSVGVPTHVKVDCSRVVSFTQFETRIPCFIYHTVQIPINTVHIVQKMLNELFWFSVLFKKRNAWRTLQRYDGMIQDNDISYSCQHRRDNMKWDFSKGDCYCDKPVDNFPYSVTTDDPFGVKQTFYDPYCGQPTLRANVWYNWLMWLRHSIEGSLADQWYVVAKTQYLSIMESVKLLFRVILAIPDIQDGRFFDIPINCGWGTGDFTNCTIRQHEQNKVNWCSGTNKQGCTCNPTLALTYDSMCQCIYYYPDAEQEVTQTGFTNRLLDKLYTPVAQHHWCGTYLAEPLLSQSEAFAYQIDNVLSQFAPGYNSKNNNYCESKSFQMFATDILQYDEGEWNAKLLGPLGIPYTKKSCKLYGAYDPICAGSMTVRSYVLTATQQVRAGVMSLASVATLDIASFQVDFSERLCDAQRTAAAASSTIASLLFWEGILGKEVNKGIAKVIYSGFDVLLTSAKGINNVLRWFTDIINDAIMGRSPERATFELIINQMNIYIDWVRRLLQGLGTLINGIEDGAGDFFFILDSIIGTIQNELSQAMLELVSLGFKVFVGIIRLFTSGTLDPTFFDDLFTLITKFFNMLLQQFGKLWSLVTKVIEPLMVVVRAIGDGVKTICNAIESAINVIPGVDVDLGCNNLRSTGHRHMFWSSPDTPLHIAEAIEWDGLSRCDFIVHRYKTFTWNELRPLEQIEIQECLEQRIIAHQLANITGLPIPKDIIYNYKRKYMLMYEVGHAMIIYLRHLAGGLTTSEMLQSMKKENIDLDLYLPAMNKIRSFVSSAVTMTNVNHVIHGVFQQYPDIHTTDSGVGNIYRLYTHTQTIAEKAYPHAQNLSLHFSKLMNTMPTRSINITQHLHVLKRPFITNDEIPMTRSKVKARRFLSPLLGAAGVDGDLTPCSQREDSYVCLDCVVVDNLLNTVIREGKRMAFYYEHTFAPIIIPDFVNYFEKKEKRSKAYRQSIADLFENIDPDLQSAGNTTKALTNIQRAQKDWDHLFKQWELRNNGNIVEIFIQFVGTVDDTYVPLFGHGLGYYISYVFIDSCPMEIIYCTTKTTQERVQAISRQFMWQAAVFGGIYALQLYSGIPVFTMASGFPAMFLIMGAIYMWTVYSYIYTCVPNIPNCLMDDLFIWFHDVAYPQCFCSIYPGLSESCDPELCFLTDRVTTFANCSTTVPLTNDMGYFWSPVFWFRSQLPEVFLWMYKTPPFSWLFKNYDSVRDIAIRAQDGVPITMAEMDCLGLKYSDSALLGIGFYLISFLLSMLIPIIIKVGIHTIKLFILMVNTMFAFGVATELQTVAGLDD